MYVSLKRKYHRRKEHVSIKMSQSFMTVFNKSLIHSDRSKGMCHVIPKKVLDKN